MFVQSATLLLVNVFEYVLNMCLEIYKLDSARFLTAAALPWQAALKVFFGKTIENVSKFIEISSL